MSGARLQLHDHAAVLPGRELDPLVGRDVRVPQPELTAIEELARPPLAADTSARPERTPMLDNLHQERIDGLLATRQRAIEVGDIGVARACTHDLAAIGYRDPEPETTRAAALPERPTTRRPARRSA